MDMKQLEFFVTACERGSLSKAAECLYTSQPNISKNIRRLERELGRPLLKRSGTGVQPTVYGKTVLEYARLILKNAAAISSISRALRPTVSAFPLIPATWWPAFWWTFTASGERIITLSIRRGRWRKSRTMSTRGFRRLESSMWH